MYRRRILCHSSNRCTLKIMFNQQFHFTFKLSYRDLKYYYCWVTVFIDSITVVFQQMRINVKRSCFNGFKDIFQEAILYKIIYDVYFNNTIDRNLIHEIVYINIGLTRHWWWLSTHLTLTTVTSSNRDHSVTVTVPNEIIHVFVSNWKPALEKSSD